MKKSNIFDFKLVYKYISGIIFEIIAILGIIGLSYALIVIFIMKT